MQSSEFDKHIRHEMDGFSLEPSENVWEKVELRIRKERKRRRIIFFWLMAAVLLAGGAGVYLWNGSTNQSYTNQPIAKEIIIENKPGNSSGSNHTTAIPTENKAASKPSGQAAKHTVSSSSTANEEKPENFTRSTSKPDKVFAAKQSTSTSNASKSNSKRDKLIARKQINNTTNETKMVAAAKQSSATTDNNDDLRSATTSHTQVDESAGNANTLVEVGNAPSNKVDTLKSIATNKANDTSSVAANHASAKTIKSKSIQRKWSYGLTVLAGMSDNVSGIGVGPATKSLQYAPPNLSSSVPTLITPIDLRFSTNVSFGAGVFIKRNFTQRTGIAVGLQYQYYAASSTVGALLRVNTSFFDTALQKQTAVSEYYANGKNLHYVNRYHFIQLPLDFAWQFNKSTARPFTLLAGVTPGYLFASNALYANDRRRIFYKEKEQFNSLQLSGQAALLFTLKSRAAYKLQLGPAFQYGFSNLTKPAVSPRQHLLFFGIKSNLAFH